MDIPRIEDASRMVIGVSAWGRTCLRPGLAFGAYFDFEQALGSVA